MSEPTAADRLLRALRVLIPSTMPEARFHGLYEYIVTGSSEGTVDARPADPSMGLPDLGDVPILPSPMGELVTANTGSACAIMFLDGKPTKPRCVSIEGPSDIVRAYADDMYLGASSSLGVARETDPVRREGIERALRYIGLAPNTPMTAVEIDKVFIGSCTNSRIEDLRAAARVVEGKRIASRIRQALVVPGSGLVKAQAEREGLDRIFKAAGFEWREPGCSMCLGMNADKLDAGDRCASTSNRNFEGRQGAGSRTHLVSPAMAAAAAIAGRFVDVRTLS